MKEDRAIEFQTPDDSPGVNWGLVTRKWPPDGVLVETMGAGGQCADVKRSGQLWFLADGSACESYDPVIWRKKGDDDLCAIANADIIAAWNACIAINPADPLAVAKGIGELVEAAKVVCKQLRVDSIFLHEGQEEIEAALAKMGVE